MLGILLMYYPWQYNGSVFNTIFSQQEIYGFESGGENSSL